MLGLRVCLISSDLTSNKLFPINPRAVTGPPKMNLLLEVERKSALIIEPRLIFVTYPDDLGGYITSNQQGKMLVQNLHRIVRRPNVTIILRMYKNDCCGCCWTLRMILCCWTHTPGAFISHRSFCSQFCSHRSFAMNSRPIRLVTAFPLFKNI